MKKTMFMVNFRGTIVNYVRSLIFVLRDVESIAVEFPLVVAGVESSTDFLFHVLLVWE